MKEKIYEHLKTYKKYNTLQLKYDVKCEELEDKIFQYKTEKRLKQLQKENYEKEIQELIEANIKYKEENTKLKKELKDLKKKKD
jgi:FMN phosphatase YigB (HAD superfamily)